MRKPTPLGRVPQPPATGRAASVLAGAAVAVAALLAGCSTPPASREGSAPAGAPVDEARPSVRLESPPTAAAPAPAPAPAAAAGPGASAAATPRDYRRDAATHLYGLNRSRIYPGRLPPLLYAVGVLQVEVDGQGQVRQLTWMRAPRHAPEVVAEIERTVRAAAPFPAPARMGRVTYTDTWLWDRSGRFQLDTLTEGQN
jgi:periplasmic protein TonB